MTSKSILYLQRSNPGAYPPVVHSTRILADAGWEVLHLGLEMPHLQSLRLAEHPNVEHSEVPFSNSTFGQDSRSSISCSSFTDHLPRSPPSSTSRITRSPPWRWRFINWSRSRWSIMNMIAQRGRWAGVQRPGIYSRKMHFFEYSQMKPVAIGPTYN